MVLRRKQRRNQPRIGLSKITKKIQLYSIT
jgi:hypothetical protein